MESLFCPWCNASEADDQLITTVRKHDRVFIVCTCCGFEAGGLMDGDGVRGLFSRILTAERLRELSEGCCAGAMAENRLRTLCTKVSAVCDALEQNAAANPYAEVVVPVLRKAIAAARPAVESLRENAPGCASPQGGDLREIDVA